MELVSGQVWGQWDKNYRNGKGPTDRPTDLQTCQKAQPLQSQTLNTLTELISF